MKLVFLSNYYNHHQKPICDAWDALTDHRFSFAETEPFDAERRALGWMQHQNVPYLVQKDTVPAQGLCDLVDAADVAIWGDAPMDLVQDRLKDGKIVFRYAERVFKHGYNYWKWLPRCVRYWQMFGRHRSLYLLAAGAYTAADYAMHGAFRGKSYRWGYFPETICYNVPALMDGKNRKKILWCGRFLDWKHPEAAIQVAARLAEAGCDFEMDLIGTGALEEALRQQIRSCNLEGKVRLLGAMPPETVRGHMETAGIYLFTSDFAEGWGAVLNESMNSGCAVVASHAIGAVPFLMKDGENGLIYENGSVDGLYRKVKWLLEHPGEQQRLGENACHTIADLWNAEVAAERFLTLAREIRDHGYCDLYSDGPCSRAEVLQNDWFRGDDDDTARYQK